MSAQTSFGSQPQNRPHDLSAHQPPRNVPAASNSGTAVRTPIGSNSSRRMKASISVGPPPTVRPTMPATIMLVPVL